MRTFLLLAVALLLSLELLGQESARYKRLEQNLKYTHGYIIPKGAGKIEGLIRDDYHNEAEKFSAVVFISKDGKKHRYGPDEIMEYGYHVDRFVSDGDFFYELVLKSGEVQLFKRSAVNSWSAPSRGMGMSHYSTEHDNFYVKRKEESSFKRVRKRGFDETFAEYFGDCASIRNRILKKELTHQDIRKICPTL